MTLSLWAASNGNGQPGRSAAALLLGWTCLGFLCLSAVWSTPELSTPQMHSLVPGYHRAVTHYGA